MYKHALAPLTPEKELAGGSLSKWPCLFQADVVGGLAECREGNGNILSVPEGGHFFLLKCIYLVT